MTSSDSGLTFDPQLVVNLSKYLTKAEIELTLHEFISDAKQILVRLEANLEANEIRDAIRNFHTLKGNSLTLGANAIAALCQDAENELKKTENLSDRLPILHKMADMLSQFSHAVKAAGY